MGLFGLFSKKREKQTNARKNTPNTNSYGERMDHLTPDGELPWGWASKNHDFTERIVNEHGYFREAYYKAKKTGILQEYAALKSLILYVEDVKKLCSQKDECFVYWCSYMVAEPKYLLELKERLEYIEEHKDELIQQEKILKKLRSDLLKIISAEPGVVQASLYSRFSPDMKHHISNELYHMEANCVIVREKQGRSYALYKK